MGLWKASRLPGRPIPADDTGRLRRPAVAGLGWAAAAAVALVIGLAGIRLVGDSLTSTPGGVLSQSQVEKALAEPGESRSAAESPSPEAPVSPTEDPSPTFTTPPPTIATTAGPPTVQAVQRSFSVRGGNTVAECKGATAKLLSWSPTQGYGVDRARAGPDREVEVRFRGGHAKSEIKVRCTNGVPVAEEKDD